MNDNRGKIYEFLINSGRVTEQQIGDSAKFVNTINTADKAKKLHDFLVGGKIFTEEELGGSDKFVGAFKFEDTQARAESYMKEVSGEMPEPKIALADVEAFNKDVDELTKVTIGKVELPKDYEAKADSLNTQIKAIEEDVFNRYSTEAKKLAQTPMTEAEYELSSKELLSKYNQEYKDKTEGARNQFEDLSVALKNYNEAVKEYNFGIENIKKKYKSGFEAEKKATVEVTDEERKWVEEIKNNPRKLNVGNAKEVSRYKDIIGRIEAQGKVEQISLEEAKYNIGEAKRYTAGVRKVNQADSEDAYMTTAERVVASTEGALREIEEAKDNGVFSNMAKGIGGGVKDYFKDYTNLIETMSNNAAIKKVADKAERIDKGSGEKLTDGETALLNAYVVADNTMRAVQDEIPEAYGIGNAVGYSFPYMLEFVVSGGAAKTPMAIAKMKILSTAAKLGVGSKLAKAGVGATVALAKAGIQTAAMPTLYKETAKKVSEGQSFPSAFANAFYEVGAETLSERAFMGKMPKGAETKNFISDILARTGNAVVGSKSALQLLKGIGEEYLEEKISESLTSAKDILQNKQSFEQAWSTFWNYKNNLRTAATVGIVSGIIHGADKAGQAFTGARIKANVDARGKILPTEVKAVIDEVMGNKELTFEQQRQIIGGVVSNVEGDKVKLIGDAASYIMAKFEQDAFKEGQSVDEVVKNSLFPQGDTEVPAEEQETPVRTDEEILAENKKISEEIDTAIVEAQGRLGLPTAPTIQISDDTEITLDRLDNNEPVTNEFINKAADELYKKYKELEAMKSADTRQYTTEQIESMQEYIGEEITKLDEYAKKQTEEGQFISEAKTGATPEGGERKDITEVEQPKPIEDETKVGEREEVLEPVQAVGEEWKVENALKSVKNTSEVLDIINTKDVNLLTEAQILSYGTVAEPKKKSVALKKGIQWREKFNDAKDIFKQSDILRAVVGSSSGVEFLNEATTIAEGMPNESNIILDILNKNISNRDKAGIVETVLSGNYDEISKTDVVNWLKYNDDVRNEVKNELLIEPKIKEQTIGEYIAEAYHMAKSGNSNPQLIEAVENLIKQQYAIQEQTTDEGVLRTEEPEVELPEMGRGNAEHKEVTEKGEEVEGVIAQPTEAVAEKAVEEIPQTEEKKIIAATAIKPKNLRDVYKAGREVFGLNRVQALAQAIVVDKMVARMAKNKGVSKGKVYEAMTFKKGGVDTAMPQGAQAAVSFLSDGSAIVHALTNPNVSSPLHEVAHIYERYMTANEKATVLRWTGDKSWTTDTSEKFARGFERYLADGVAPTEALRRIFERFKEWMTEIYNGITGSEIDIELNDDMRALYGQMLGGKGVRPSTPKAAKTEAELLKEADDLFNQVLFQAPRSPIGFYSTVENALDAIKQDKGTPEQFKAMLLKNGAKQAEMDWMGWDSQFANSKSITKADIQQWIDGNKIEVEEVKKSKYGDSSRNNNTELIYPKIIKGLDENGFLEEVISIENNPIEVWKANPTFTTYDKMRIFLNKYDVDVDTIVSEVRNVVDETKYSQYQLPGGENYKEVLLTMPEKRVYVTYSITDDNVRYGGNYKVKNDVTGEEILGSFKTKEAAEKWIQGQSGSRYSTKDNFKSSHFEEPNILAHIRFNERTDSEGNRVLFIEEFQSDWAQKGKKEGFVDNSEYEAIPDGENKWDVGGINVLYFERGKDGKNYRTVNKSNEQVWFATLQEATKEASNTAKDRFRDREIGKVPDMPFKQTPQWVNLALRRMIRYAAENGFDRIAWTTGEQQAERYDLSKAVDEIKKVYLHDSDAIEINHKTGGESVLYYDEKGIITDNDGISIRDSVGKHISEAIGKDLAEKVMQAENNTIFSGLDLKVGGSGMKAFYDSIVPNAAKELGKKFGAKVETVEMETGTQQSLPITESMRQSAMEGMPLFQAPTDALTKALNRLIDAAEKAVGKNSAKVTEYVNKYITDKNLPIDKSIVDDILSQRGYTPKPRKARSAEAIEKSIWGLRVEELEPDEKLRAKLIEDKFSSYVPEKWETVQRISDAMYQEMGDTAEDRVENVLSKIKDINVARDYKMTIIANAFNEVNGLIENSTDPEAWRDVKEALYEMMLAHSISMGRSFNYMKNLNRMVFGENFFERMANKKHSKRVEKFVEKHKERIGKKFKAESAKLYDEAARENIQSEEVQKAIKKVAEKNGYRSATKEKLAEIRKKKEDLIARHKAAIAQRRGQLSASVLPMGITPEDVEFIGEYVSLLLQEGVYKTKALTDRIRWYVKDAMGVDITEEEARDLLPEDVDGVNFDEWQEGKKKEASAEVLAGRIVGMVKEKKADNDPVKMMIDILTAKARERIPATKRAKMTPLEVLVQAIRNRKEYQKTWEDAKAVVEKRIAAMKVSDEAKADMMSKVEEAYKTATELPFSDAVVTKAVRQTLEELEYVLNKIVLSTATEKAVVKDELKKRIVEQTGLEDEDADVLAKAIEQAFNAALDSKAQRTVENMIYRLDRQKDVSATKIVEYLNNKGSKMGKDNPYSFLINNLREQAIAKLREIDAENKKTKGVEKYGEAMLKGMSTGRALSLAFIDDIELKEAIVKAQQAVMDKVNDGTYLKGLNEEMRNVIIADLSHFDSRAQTAILKTEEAIIRSRAANELIQFVRIGAFDNGDFAKAYAMAKGMTPPTKAQIDHIKSMYNRMAKEQSEMIKKELEAELLAYMANMGGVDLADILTATLAFSMLGNVAVQTKNTGLAAGAMMIDFLREASRRAITMDKRGLDELVKAYTRNRGLNMAINTFKTGVSHLPQKFDIPDVLYRAKRDVKDSRGDKLIKRALAVYSFTMNWMNASDSFFVFTNAEARIALMTLDKGREELRRNIGVNQKAFLDQFISENLYSVEMREQAEAQVAEDEAELVKQGIDPYTARQRKLAVYDKIDQLRDPELRGEAFDLATRLFGNTDFYGALGMMMDGFVHYIRTIPVIGNTPLLAPLVFFTRIATNIATYSLNMTPVGWVRLYAGKYGATLDGKNQRYVREISASERKAIMQYQVMGLIIGTAAVSIFLGGDDDDPWFAVCGTGINAAVNGFPYGYKGEKWKKNTIKLGDTYLSYDGTVMQPMFALIGEAMDGYRFNRDKDGKREKDLNKFFMDLAVYFAVSPVSIVNSNYLSLIESVGTTLYGAAEKVINREETIASISGALAMDIPLNNYLNMMYLGDVYEVVKMAMEIPDNDGDKLFDTMAKRTYLEMILNDDRMYRTDVFGDAVIKNPTYFTRGIAEYKGMSEWAEYNAKYYKAIPEARVSDPEFFIEKKGVTEKRSLNAYDKNEAYAFWRYQNIRGRYIKERIMMLKADNVTGDAYREEIKKAIAQAGAFARSEIQAFINEGGLYLK